MEQCKLEVPVTLSVSDGGVRPDRIMRRYQDTLGRDERLSLYHRIFAAQALINRLARRRSRKVEVAAHQIGRLIWPGAGRAPKRLVRWHLAELLNRIRQGKPLTPDTAAESLLEFHRLASEGKTFSPEAATVFDELLSKATRDPVITPATTTGDLQGWRQTLQIA